MRATICYPYYENPGMLEIQLYNYANFSDYCDLIVVDDGSPKNPAKDVISNQKGVSLYRVIGDHPWHQHGCRNLAAMVAETPWLFMSDIDHLIEPENAKKLFSEVHPPDEFFMFSRVTAPTMVYHKPHPNSFYVSKEKYWEVGGYDEDFCTPGNPPMYGGDGIFLRQLSEKANCVMRHDIRLVRYPREYVEDASTTQFDRKGEYKQNYRAMFDKKRAENDLVPKDPIRFKWERLL